MEDRNIPCLGCGKEFVFRVKDQEFYKEKGFTEPKRCRECRAKQKLARSFEEQPMPTASTSEIEIDWGKNCIVCNRAPVISGTGLCGDHIGQRVAA